MALFLNISTIFPTTIYELHSSTYIYNFEMWLHQNKIKEKAKVSKFICTCPRCIQNNTRKVPYTPSQRCTKSQRLLLEFSNSRRLEADFCNIVLYIT